MSGDDTKDPLEDLRESFDDAREGVVNLAEVTPILAIKAVVAGKRGWFPCALALDETRA